MKAAEIIIAVAKVQLGLVLIKALLLSPTKLARDIERPVGSKYLTTIAIEHSLLLAHHKGHITETLWVLFLQRIIMTLTSAWQLRARRALLGIASSRKDIQGLSQAAPKLTEISFHHDCTLRRFAKPRLTVDRLYPLTGSDFVATLTTLSLVGHRSDHPPPSIMSQFQALTVLAINYGKHGLASAMDLVLGCLQKCASLRRVLVMGADRISDADIKRFALAVGNSNFPALRNVRLVPREYRNQGYRLPDAHIKETL